MYYQCLIVIYYFSKYVREFSDKEVWSFVRNCHYQHCNFCVSSLLKETLRHDGFTFGMLRIVCNNNSWIL